MRRQDDLTQNMTRANTASWQKGAISEGDLGFQLRVIQSNTTIPAILVDEKGDILTLVNVDTMGKSSSFLQRKLSEFKLENEPIVVPVDENTDYKVYYGSSTVLTQLQYYPYVVLGIVALFMFVSYAAFSYSEYKQFTRKNPLNCLYSDEENRQ